MFSIEALLFLASSVLTLLLDFYATSTLAVQQILAVLLLILLLLLNRKLPFSQSLSIKNRSFRVALLFVSALFVQLLVVSTGGFYSIFLILLHIFTLGTSFLLNLRSSMSFLIFSLFILIAHVFLNQPIWIRFQEDPWSLALYLTSFIVVIPLSQLLMRSYHLNEIISNALTSHIAMLEDREKSILAGLSELVLVTNKSLFILSANEAVERTLGLMFGEIMQKPLLTILLLKDHQGKPASLESLGINRILSDKTTHVVKGYFLYTKAANPIEVAIQVHPVADLEGKISQLAFVIKSTKENKDSHQLHGYLEQARVRHRVFIEHLANLPQLRRQMELYSKIEDDLITALEIEHHPIVQTVTREDIGLLCSRVVSVKQNFAKTLSVSLAFVQASENLLLTLSVDAKWLDLLLRKVLDIAIFLASKEPDPRVELTVRSIQSQVEVMITASCPKVSQQASTELFSQYYGDLGAKTNLILGSGLEGFIAKTTAVQLGIPLNVKFDNNHIVFSLVLG